MERRMVLLYCCWQRGMSSLLWGGGLVVGWEGGGGVKAYASSGQEKSEVLLKRVHLSPWLAKLSWGLPVESVMTVMKAMGMICVTTLGWADVLPRKAAYIDVIV